jgi:ubiquinol-cytochrome c reductase cytochrome b/c1 subunit
MAGPSTYVPKSGIERWLDARLPVVRMMHGQFVEFPIPRNLNYMYTFGGILMIMLVSQIITGIVLVMHYTPHADMAFDVGRTHHARRELWLAVALHACGWRVDVLRGGLPAYLPRPLLRLLQGAA